MSIIKEMLEFNVEANRKFEEMEFAPIHDICAIAYAIDASLFEGKKCHVYTSLSSETLA